MLEATPVNDLGTYAPSGHAGVTYGDNIKEKFENPSFYRVWLEIPSHEFHNKKTRRRGLVLHIFTLGTRMPCDVQ